LPFLQEMSPKRIGFSVKAISELVLGHANDSPLWFGRAVSGKA
jgi:hypothetical protein